MPEKSDTKSHNIAGKKFRWEFYQLKSGPKFQFRSRLNLEF